jgi:hypothetical protein
MMRGGAIGSVLPVDIEQYACREKTHPTTMRHVLDKRLAKGPDRFVVR